VEPEKQVGNKSLRISSTTEWKEIGNAKEKAGNQPGVLLVKTLSPSSCNRGEHSVYDERRTNNTKTANLCSDEMVAHRQQLRDQGLKVGYYYSPLIRGGGGVFQMRFCLSPKDGLLPNAIHRVEGGKVKSKKGGTPLE